MVAGLCLALIPAAPVDALAAAPREPSAPSAAWTISADGHTVVDSMRRLEWQRCVLGTRWNGRGCAGTPRQVDWLAAREAADRAAEAAGHTHRRTGEFLPTAWRLPRAPEWVQAARSLQTQPSLFLQLFPNTPEEWAWTGTAALAQESVNPYSYNSVMRQRPGGVQHQLDVLSATAVHLVTAEVRGNMPKREPLPVRLVRSLDP